MALKMEGTENLKMSLFQFVFVFHTEYTIIHTGCIYRIALDTNNIKVRIP